MATSERIRSTLPDYIKNAIDQFIIAVELDDPLASCMLDARVPGRAETTIDIVLLSSDGRMIHLLHYRGRAIGRSVIDDDDLEIGY